MQNPANAVLTENLGAPSAHVRKEEKPQIAKAKLPPKEPVKGRADKPRAGRLEEIMKSRKQ